MSEQSTVAGRLSLEGRCALVTGGAGGIGQAVVRVLAEAGAKVCSVDLPESASPEGASLHLCADLSQESAAQALIQDCADRLAPPSLLVHCAGITRDGVLWKLSAESWSQVLRVNLDAAFYLLKHLTPHFRQQDRSAAVLLSSINGERGKFGQSNYAASKAGLIGLAKTAARELGRFGCRVNVIAPGMVRTQMTKNLPPEIQQRAAEETVLGRIAEPQDIADAALFLCSDLSSQITGQVLRVDGGQLIA